MGPDTMCQAHVGRYIMGVPFMMKMEVAPVSAMTYVEAIAIALAYSKCQIFEKQFDAITVASSSLIDDSAALSSKWLYRVGYNEVY
jgi:hypothetical protein